MQPTLKTNNLRLRAFKQSDAARVQLLAGDVRVVEMTENIPHPYEDGMAEYWIERISIGWENGTVASYALCLDNHIGSDKVGSDKVASDKEDKLIGCCSLQISQKHKRATLGYWIGFDYWGKGYCTEAAAAVVAFGFETLALHRIHAEHLTKNPASGAVMRKIGMKHEATKLDYAICNGQYENMESYYILSKPD